MIFSFRNELERLRGPTPLVEFWPQYNVLLIPADLVNPERRGFAKPLKRQNAEGRRRVKLPPTQRLEAALSSSKGVAVSGDDLLREEEARVEEVEALVSEDTTRLVLRPVARAVAGAGGVAVATPVARAVLARGRPVSIEFDPDSVAIAGPGGRAHSHPSLVVSYSDQTDEQ